MILVKHFKLQRYLIFTLLSLFTLNLNAQSIQRSELEILGKKFKEVLELNLGIWLTGGDRIPYFTLGIQDKISSLILNTRTPYEVDLSQIYNNSPDIQKNIPVMEQMLGKSHEARGHFISKLQGSTVTGSLFDEYGYFINESRRIGCWRSDTPYKDQCKTLSNLGFGILFAMYESRNILGSPAVPIDRTLKALIKFLAGEQLPPSLEIAVRSIGFDVSGDPNELWNIGYRLNEETKVFSDFGTGALNPFDINKLVQQGAYRNNFINQFRNSVDILQSVLNDRKRGWNLSERTASRIFELKESLGTIAKHSSNNEDFSVHELYSGLGVLHQYYEQNADFIKLDKLKKFRGELRADFSSLTSSFWERALLKFWGFLSAYGTSITGMTIFLVLGTIFIAVLCLHSAFRRNESLLISTSIQSFLKIITIRGEAADLYGNKGIVLFFEVICFIYIPTYFGFLITFLLRSH